MSYRNLLLNAVSGLINNQVGDLNDTVTYRSFISNGYDIDTGLASDVFAEQPGLKVVFSKFKIDEKDTEVNVLKDEKCYIAGKDLTFIPKKTDQIVKSNGQVWEVFQDKGVTGGSLWILSMRLT